MLPSFYRALPCVLALWFVSVFGYRDNYTIGGFFNIFDSSNHVNEPEFQRLAGFLMAIDEINNRSDILPNIKLNYLISSPNNFMDASVDASEMAPKIIGAVGALPTSATSSIDQVFADTETVMVHSFASDTDFGNGLKYPFKVQTCPVDSFQGMVLQNMMCNFFNFTRVVIFASNDEFGNKAAIESGDGSYCEITNLGTFLFPSYVTDFTPYIQKAMKLEASVFLLFMGPKNAAMLMEQGHDQGLFVEGSQILGPSNLLEPSLFNFFTPTADIHNIMKGVIAIKFWPSYRIDVLGSQLDFVNNFRALSLWNNCSDVMDNGLNHYLYPQNDINNHCTSLNFSSFDTNGSNIDPYVSLTYDAMYTLAYGMDAVVRSNQDLNGNTILNAIFNNVSFVGPSGLIEIYEGMSNFGYYARGDREVGHHYKIMNFNADAYFLNPNDSFVQVLVWSAENGVQPCDSVTDCADIIYSTVDNSMPSCYPPYTFAHPPSTIKIGGLFSPVDDFNHVDKVEAENLAAFLMAIREINNKTDGIADDLLPNTEIVFAVQTSRGFDGAVTSAEKLVGSFYGTGVNAVVCGLPNMETMASDQLLGDHKIVQAHSMATDTNLGTGTQFPYKLQTCPIDSFQGMVLQNIICNFYHYAKVTIFATNDVFGSKAAMEAVDGTYCDIQVLSTHLFRSDTTDFSVILRNAISAGAQIFLFFMESKNAANLLEQGYNIGLFREGTQIFTSNYSMGSDLFTYFTADADVPAIMKGVIGVQYWPDYSISRTTTGLDFMRRWKEQTYTGLGLRDGEVHCDVSRDDALSTFLYTSQTNQSLCAGLNFSTYESDGANLNPYAGLTYDATMLIAHGLHVVIENGWDVTGDNLLKAVFSNVSFVGVSGLIESYEGMASFGFYARGDREVGHHYRIMNFNADAYATAINDSFVQVMVWSVEDGIQACDDLTTCVDVIYNTADNFPALDTPPDIIIILSPAEKGILFALAAILFLTVIIYAAGTIYFRKTRLMKASQFDVVTVILLGGIFAGIRVIIAGLPISNESCTAGLWFGHLAFILLVSGMSAKCYRLDSMLNNVSGKKRKFSKRDVFISVVVCTLLMIIYLIILTLVGSPHESATSVTSSNQTTHELRCSFRYTTIHTVLLAIDAAFVLYGLRLSWNIKDFPDIVNEGKFIASGTNIYVNVVFVFTL